MMEPVITARLIIRKPAVSDLQDFLAYRNDEENLRLQPIQPMSEDEAAQFLQEQMHTGYENAEDWIMFAIELKDEHKMIGEAGIYISADNNGSGDIGWSVHKDYQRKGYAMEAAQFLLKYAFQVRALDSVTATCNSANIASIRLMQGLGMSYINNKQPENGKDNQEDSYTISRQEWFAR